MKKIRILSLLVAILVFTAFIAGCGQNAATPSETTKAADTGAGETTAAAEPTGEALEPYTFTHYFNYDWWGLKPWGVDMTSKYMQKKFNITVEFSKPDSDPQAKLNVMISSGDLPDSIMMDRGVDLRKLAQLGLLMPLEPYMEKNPNLTENVRESTRELLKIDGKLYSIPNWSRKAASGGNDTWIYNQRLYKAAGSPALNTLEDLHAYALKIKNDVPKNNEGLSTIPFTADDSADGWKLGRAFYRSFGGVIDGWYAVSGGKYQSVFRDPVFKQSTMEINRWWRDGLINPTQFTDTPDQILEKIVAGRTALMWYDHSKNESNKYRTILKETFPDDSYEITPDPFPPANGLTPDKIYADHQSTVGWNVTVITKNAEKPQRIFDLWTWLLTKEGSINMMYGPQGENWDSLDDKGLPILKKAESELKSEEIDRLGSWFWAIPGHSDNVDTTKFAVNDMLPPEKQNWVIKTQAHILTPRMWLTDEFVGIPDVVDPKSDAGIARTLCEDYIKANYPKVIMAKSEAEAQKLFDGIIAFLDKNGFAKVEEAYNTKYQDNVKLVGSGLKK